MIEIPYEGPRFSPPDYKSKAYSLERKLEALDELVTRWEESNDPVSAAFAAQVRVVVLDE